MHLLHRSRCTILQHADLKFSESRARHSGAPSVGRSVASRFFEVSSHERARERAGVRLHLRIPNTSGSIYMFIWLGLAERTSRARDSRLLSDIRLRMQRTTAYPTPTPDARFHAQPIPATDRPITGIQVVSDSQREFSPAHNATDRAARRALRASHPSSLRPLAQRGLPRPPIIPP